MLPRRLNLERAFSSKSMPRLEIIDFRLICIEKQDYLKEFKINYAQQCFTEI